MRCPNNEDCKIEFFSVEGDNGDSSTPYFSSWTWYEYDHENSYHIKGCTPLTDKQIETLEEEYNKYPTAYEPIIFDD